MLSYRHAFHASNQADVLKHFIEVQLLHYLAQKDKPFWFIDTHAGAGCYSLDSGYATQNAEYESGIARLWQRRALVLIDPPYEEKQDYQRVVAALREGLKRFASGVYAVWYPQLQRAEGQPLPEK